VIRKVIDGYFIGSRFKRIQGMNLSPVGITIAYIKNKLLGSDTYPSGIDEGLCIVPVIGERTHHVLGPCPQIK
jgi:hypothetical protein